MAGSVHLALGSVAALAQEAGREGVSWLTPAERVRCDRISARERRAQFIAGRWLARRLLCQAYGGELPAWSLSAPERGPPEVQARLPGSRVHASISHSGDAVACAVAEVPIGVDVEVPRADRARDYVALGEAVCSPGELERVAGALPGERSTVFHECWTMKEAWLKSRGEDMSPARMARIHTAPAAADATFNGHVWRGADVTVALVAPPGVPVRWWGPPPGPCVSWCVVDAA
ncbi:MAG TPA: 4'-phosphopantetheinyl transferase superfamily protein [Ramlibacter sp.]|nr:4'-phosphopantetheinyl transferase superfamily protein [Ramlibacter sp.]